MSLQNVAVIFYCWPNYLPFSIFRTEKLIFFFIFLHYIFAKKKRKTKQMNSILL